MAGRQDAGRQRPPGPVSTRDGRRSCSGTCARAGRDPDRVVAWLAATAHASVSLQEGGGRLLAGTRLPLDEALVADVTSGRIASAALEDRGRHLRLVRVERSRPAQAAVLAVARGAPFDRHVADIVTHAAQVVERSSARRQ
ncbi:PucR family transcriptional regulator OS=Streptomyces tendae OX=1932 GN=GUR47_22430 PE=4 SV=1 [Streptomyces tendae]